MKYFLAIKILLFSLGAFAQQNYIGYEVRNQFRSINKSNPTYLSCVNHHLDAYYPRDISEEICSQYENRRELTLNSKFHECVEYFKNLSVANGGDESALLFCFHFDFRQYTIKNLEEKCVSRALAAPTGIFWSLEDYEIIRKQNLSENAFVEVLKNCQSSTYKTEVKINNEFFKLHSRTVYHSSITNNKYLKNLSGLSGIVFNKQEEILVTVSDEKYNSGLSYFKIINRQTPIYPFSIDHVKSQSMNYTLSDIEDIVMTASGNFIISQEIITEDQLKNSDKNSEVSSSYIVEVSPNRSLVRHIPLPSEFFKSIVEQEFDCPEGFFSSLAKAFGGIFGNKNKEEEPKKCIAKKSVNGIKYNRGIEALAIDESKNILYYAPEQPFVKLDEASANRINNNFLPFYAQDLLTNEYVKYQYPIEQKFDNGLVAMTYYKNNIIITLERFFDPNKKEAEVKLYKIDLNGLNSDEVIEKKLLLNLQELKSDFGFGFKKIDNFEGMTFGPLLPNGHRSLILVSDNNNSLKQKIDFLVLELITEL